MGSVQEVVAEHLSKNLDRSILAKCVQELDDTLCEFERTVQIGCDCSFEDSCTQEPVPKIVLKTGQSGMQGTKRDTGNLDYTVFLTEQARSHSV